MVSADEGFGKDREVKSSLISVRALVVFIHNFFEDLRGRTGINFDHIHNEELVCKSKGYRIRPDCAYIFPDKVIVFEFERNIRPVESISKYWWLFEKTDWKSTGAMMYCYVFLFDRALENEIRVESVQILGEELERKYSTFKFRFFKKPVDLAKLRSQLEKDIKDP